MLQPSTDNQHFELRGQIAALELEEDVDSDDDDVSYCILAAGRNKPQDCARFQSPRYYYGSHLELRGRLADLDDEADSSSHHMKRIDPIDSLDDDLMKHILSFLGCCGGTSRCEENNNREEIQPGKDDQPINIKQQEMLQGENKKQPFLGLMECARLYYTLTCVSKTWSDFVQRCFLDGSWLIDANFQSSSQQENWTRRSKRKSCIMWLTRNKLPLKSLLVSLTEQEVPDFINMLEECSTQQLTKCHICLVKPLSAYRGSSTKGRTTQGKQQRNAQATSDTVLLLNSLAKQCPNLQEICLPSSTLLPLEGNEISALFQLPSIRRLHLGLKRSNPSNDHSMALEERFIYHCFFNAISNLPNLQRLELTHGPRRQGEVQGPNCFCLNIGSPSLRSLDVSGLLDGVYAKVNCPQLKTFVCKRGSGSLPIIKDLHNFMDELPPKLLQNRIYDGDLGGLRQGRGHGGVHDFGFSFLTLPSNILPFVGVKVPGSCACTIQNFYYAAAAAAAGAGGRTSEPVRLNLRDWFQKYKNDLSHVQQALHQDQQTSSVIHRFYACHTTEDTPEGMMLNLWQS